MYVLIINNYCRFPKELVTRAEWIKACRNHVTWVPKRTSTVCSRHFEASCFVLLANNKRRLKQSAVPTLQLSEVSLIWLSKTINIIIKKFFNSFVCLYYVKVFNYNNVYYCYNLLLL